MEYSKLFEYLDALYERNRKEFYDQIEYGDYYKSCEKLGMMKQITEIRQKLMEIAYENRF